MTAQSHIPHRFRYSSFKEYEPCIVTILERYPEVAIFDPRQAKPPKAIDTFTCRLRDAMKAYIEYRYPSEKIDYHRFCEIRKELQVSQRRGLVFVGTHTALRALEVTNATTEYVAPTPTGVQLPFEWNYDLTPGEVTTLMRAAHNRLLSRPIVLRLTPTQAEHYSSSYYIDLEEKEGLYILT